MIYNSIIPEEIIFDGFDKMKLNFKEININDITMVIEPVDINKGKIIRIISPNALDYLNPKYLPGEIIYFNSTIFY